MASIRKIPKNEKVEKTDFKKFTNKVLANDLDDIVKKTIPLDIEIGICKNVIESCFVNGEYVPTNKDINFKMNILYHYCGVECTPDELSEFLYFNTAKGNAFNVIISHINNQQLENIRKNIEEGIEFRKKKLLQDIHPVNDVIDSIQDLLENVNGLVGNIKNLTSDMDEGKLTGYIEKFLPILSKFDLESQDTNIVSEFLKLYTESKK